MKRLLLLSVLLLVGCGGSSPVGPSPNGVPTPTPSPRIVDGVTGQPVMATGGPGSYSAAGYLTREQRAGDVFLWPAPDPDYVQTLVYGESALSGRMTRWDGGPFVSCGVDAAEIRTAIAEMVAVTGFSTGTGPCNVTWEIDGRDPEILKQGVGAVTYRTIAGFRITAARVVFRNSNFSFAAHEGGHVLGLGHSTTRSDRMYPYSNSTAGGYSQQELVQLNMMFRHRAAGNSWPDREP